MKNALRELLNSLDQIDVEYSELQDTAVREYMREAIHQVFVTPEPDYELPTYFGMFCDEENNFSNEGNERVRAALLQFLNHPEVIAAGAQLQTPQQRLEAFQDEDVQSMNGSTYEDYFGYVDFV